jgi:hypothetical protein
MRLSDTYTPREVVASLVIDSLKKAYENPELAATETGTFRKNVRKQILKYMEKTAQRYNFEYVRPSEPEEM